MLQNSLELIVQYPVPGGYQCRGFKNLRLSTPVFLVFDGALTSDQSVAHLLGEAFCQEVSRYAEVVEEPPPCLSSIPRPQIQCHALGEPACRKIFVRPAATATPSTAGTWPAPSAETLWLSHVGDPMWPALPVLPSGADVSAHVPSPWRGINVCWATHPAEVLWAVFQRVGLAPEESRIFISYVRQESSAIADQLFASLTQAGFDVFLDRFSVPIGVDFQERLMQDLSDKAMVVLLNTVGTKNSYWVGKELAAIKEYRLGLLELLLPGGEKRADLDSDFTQVIALAELVTAGSNYSKNAQMFSSATLENVVSRIKETHGRALHRRRYSLINNFVAALANVGKTARVLPDGTFVMSSPAGSANAVVSFVVRSPELGDFCSLHNRGSVSAACPGWLISPSPFSLPQRRDQISWLGGLSNIQHINEAQINDLVANL